MQTYGVPQAGPQGPAVMAAAMQNSLDSLLSGNLGSSRPSYATAGMEWKKTINSTTVEVYLYDGTSDILLRTYNPTAHSLTSIVLPDGNVTAGKIAAGAVNSAGIIADNLLTFAKFAASAVADQAEAEAGTSNTEFMTPLRTAQAIAALVASGVPAGVVADFAGATAPTGWLMCYGQEVSRATYAALFSAIGTTYGTGNGTTTFNLPDCRGRVVIGQDDMGGVSANRITVATSGIDGDVLGDVGGSEGGTITFDKMPAHTHPYTIQTGNTGTTNNPARGFAGGTVTSNTGSAGSGGTQANPTVPPAIIMNKIIKI